MSNPGRVCLVGLGLIGGSIGMALAQRDKSIEVVGVDLTTSTVENAVLLEAINRGTTDLSAGVEGADLVILATPPGRMGPVARAMSSSLSPGTVVTDVASTKEQVVKEIENALPPGVSYLGGHPMAGSEKGGLAAADPYLFENAVWALTPSEHSSVHAREVLTWLIETVGAHSLVLSPEEHDQAVAAASHLPHVVAAALVNSLEECPTAVKMAGRGFRDTTRVAAGDPALWRDILTTNRGHLLETLRQFQASLNDFLTALISEDGQELEELLIRGRKGRSMLPSGLRAYLPFLEEIVITITDRPGSLAEVTRVLGEAGINIADIEIMGVREGEAGSVRLGFVGDLVARRALNLLEAAGIKGRRR